MLKIWGRASSSNVMKVLWLCEELSIPYERIDAGGEFGRTTEPFYLAMNPNSRVPTLEEEDGYALWESNSILRYLVATRAAGDPIHPTAPKARGEVERWMDWQLASLNGPMGVLFLGLVRTPEAQRNQAAIAGALKEAAGLWGIVDRQLEGRQYLTGGFTLADIVLGPYLHRWFVLPIERPELARLEAWYERLKAEHPGFVTHCAGELA
ncbi:glutathione S-transferase [Siccirubricoccus sp. KC 17139]|uniref:Glutathione S-transferase n=1 Tax=Siccirubricoccus soli TaxID=2899147 RepID=A0ABT1DAR5_9PROT|nr:glutathione S-transferase [Siccirubricoccus soli]MCO6419030.1 glutathione S-transferase [Siccirubricoccus soli]MCP2685165.1 glutathione S-transferase [Siccirubricoccus soli]